VLCVKKKISLCSWVDKKFRSPSVSDHT